MLQITFILLSIVFAINGQVLFLNKCPTNVHGMEKFAVSKYLGKWYEAERYFALFETGGKCVTADYSQNANGTVHVLNTQQNSLTGAKSTIEGYAKPTSKEGRGELTVVFPSLPIHFEAPYLVLDTDYDSYAVVWSCENVGLTSARFAWILTRERNPSVETMKKAYAVLDKNHITRKFLLRTDQTKCAADH